VLHGGGLDENAPFERGPAEMKGVLARLAEERGYVVASPKGYDMHGGYGNTFPQAPGTRPFPQTKPMTPEEAALNSARSERDTLNVLEIVAKEYNVDRSRVVMMGNSMGMIDTIRKRVKYDILYSLSLLEIPMGVKVNFVLDDDVKKNSNAITLGTSHTFAGFSMVFYRAYLLLTF
jgi:predicted peptidase